MSRLKKKPDFSTENLDNRLLSQVAQYYQELIKDEMYTDICDAETVDIERDVSYDDEETAYKYVILTAEAFRVSPMKMRKLLITAGVCSTVTSRLIDRLRKGG